ncbi:MAG: NAD-dependent protein deacylase [Pirellulaceae bacterium]|nr:NAD-dependent protein deacylase [Pirellulaceae bacterium]
MLSISDQETVSAIVQALRLAKSVLFITGAGVSAESGIPTYRGIGGLYNVGPTAEGYAIEEILSSMMLRDNPALCWKYLAQIGLAVQAAKHNRAHEIMAEMEDHFERLWVLTQNIDGFHRSAGSKNLVEVHGNMHFLSCTRCDYKTRLDRIDHVSLPPRCPRCKAIVRPDVVLFGELIADTGIDRLQAEQQQYGFDVVFSVGTTSVFPYIQAPIFLASAAGKTTVEINPSETEVSDIVRFRLKTGAVEALSAIWSEFQNVVS